MTGWLDKFLRCAITSSKDGLFAFADNIPVMSAGIPADLRVVETWSLIQDNAP